MQYTPDTRTLVPGSLQAIADRDNVSVAESFLSADAIILVDVSGSMGACDVDVTDARRAWEIQGKSRYDVACLELKRLQAELPGKIAVIAFSDRPEFAPAGIPRYIGSGTDLARALAFVHVADGTGIRFVIISDGWPDDTTAAEREAKKFTDRIDTIFVGPKGDAGERFLRELASAHGGQHSTNQVHQLAERVSQLLLTARVS